MKFFLKELATSIFEGNIEECDFPHPRLLHVLQEKSEDPRKGCMYDVKGKKDGCLPKN
jgi:hypothetical protein